MPITSKQPDAGRHAVEIPEGEKPGAGLSLNFRLWIIMDDVNADEPGQSYYITNTRRLGRFSRAWFVPLMREFVKNRRALRITDRTR